MFAKFASISPIIWAILAALAILGIVLYAVAKNNQRWTTRMLANAAMCIALAFILSYVRLYKLPQGGSITLASMLPILLFSYAYGVGPGMLVGFAYGILQFIQDAYFVHPIELLLDYPLAFAMLGLAGLAKVVKNENAGFIGGIVLGVVGRFLCAFLAGIIFFGSYAPEGQSVFAYSAIYNGLYLVPETIICLVLSLIPQVKGFAKQLAGNR